MHLFMFRNLGVSTGIVCLTHARHTYTVIMTSCKIVLDTCWVRAQCATVCIRSIHVYISINQTIVRRVEIGYNHRFTVIFKNFIIFAV